MRPSSAPHSRDFRVLARYNALVAATVTVGVLPTLLPLPALAQPSPGQVPAAIQSIYGSNDPERIRNGDPFEPFARLEPVGKQQGRAIPGCALTDPGPVANDATADTGIMPFHQVVQTACALASRHDRVSVVGGWQAVSGRDVFALHITEPNAEVVANSATIRDRLLADPVGVAEDLAANRLAPWRPVVMVSANIHGSEGEGTDAVLAWASYLGGASASDPLVEGATGGPTVGEFLTAFELVLVPSVNPDGRTAGTRRNGAGIDLNRDQVTRSQPETVALQALLQRYQPVMHLDLHGYYSPNGDALGLVEPAGTPHNPAINRPVLEQRMAGWLSRLDANVINRPEVKAMGFDAKTVGVAQRDEGNGRWDDWAPVYTSVWSTLMNGAGVTVETPYNPFGRPKVNGINPAVAGNISFFRGVLDAMVLAALDQRQALAQSLVDYRVQAVMGERGTTGQDWPEGWVISGPDAQHPAANVRHLEAHLRANGITVHPGNGGVEANGKTYPKGSLVIPANQPYRALAAVMLSPGATVPGDRTTDLAAWSPGALWGVQVDQVPKGAKMKALPGDPPASNPTVPRGPWQVLPRSLAQVQVINRLVRNGATLYRDPATGMVYMPARFHEDIAKDFQSASFAPAQVIPAKVEQIRKLRVGVTADGAHTNWLEMLGYEPVFVDIGEGKALPTNLDVLILNRHVGAELGSQIRDWVHGGGALLAIEGGQYVLHDIGLTDVKTEGVGRRSAGLLMATQSAAEPVMPNRLPTQVELAEPYQVWPKVPTGYHAVQTVPAGTTITSGLWLGKGPLTQPAYLTIAGEVGKGRVVASGAQRIFRHHMVGQADELFEWLHWVARPKLVDHDLTTTSRIAGPDRVGTAINLSHHTHPKGAETVVITAAQAWADTLVAGPYATAHKAPILLSEQDSIRPEVVDRLRALAPKRIVVIGGPQAVGDQVVRTLRALPSVATVERLAGPNRYDTSAAVAATFAPGSAMVIATGDQPADALTGGVVAARTQGATVLLPQNAPAPVSVRTQVQRLNPPELTVIGGEAAIANDQVTTLATPINPNPQGLRKVTRLAGNTRFETAAVVAQSLAPTPMVALANGYSTADALLATPYVHQHHGAVLLTQADALPPVTSAALATLKPTNRVLIGGNQVIHDLVEATLAGG